MAHNDELPLSLDALLAFKDTDELTEWQKQMRAALIPTPSYVRTYTKMQSEHEAAGVPVPGGIKLIASAE